MLSHIKNLPPESAFVRKHMNAPMGWDNNTEMLAMAVDALNALLRLTYNVNAEQPSTDPLPQIPRPYAPPPEPETVSASQFNDILSKG